MGMFDDLVPGTTVEPPRATTERSGLFADLTPAPARDWSQFPTWGDALGEIRKLPVDAQQSAMKEWASQTVAKERKDSPIMTSVDDFVRRLARGTPLGSWADEGNAVIASTLGIAPYEQQKAYEDAKDTQGDASATKVGSLPVIGDVTTAGLTKLAGGIVSAPISPGVRVVQGQTLLPSMANAAVTGAGYGAVYGAGEGEGTERLGNAGKGAALGAAIGTAAPVLGHVAGNAWDYGANAARGIPAELNGVSRGAVKRVARAATDDDLVNRYPQQAADLGHEGMLMDMGANLRGQASAIANQPGAGQRIIRDALENRAEQAPARISNDINRAFGPEQNLVQLERNVVQQANAAADPHYQAFYSQDVALTPQLNDIWQRLPASIMRDAEQLARVEGHQLTVQVPRGNGLPPIEQPSARGWDYFKRAVQDEIDRVGPTSEMGRALTRLDNQLRQTVDAAVNPANPAAGPWAQARAAAGTGKQFQQGLSDGDGIFSRPKTHNPDQVADDLANGSQVYQDGYRAGARGDLANMMNDAGSQFGPSGDKAARKGLWSRNAERKVQQLVAVQPQVPPHLQQARTQDLLRRRDAESTFGETQNAVTANSATSARLQAQKEFPNPVENQGSGKSVKDLTFPGMAAELGRKALNAMTLGAHNERLAAMANNAARVLSATGMQRETYFRGLERYLAGRGVSTAQAQRISQAVEALLISGVPTATSDATASPRP